MQNKILTQHFLQKIKCLRVEDNVFAGQLYEKNVKLFLFSLLKSLKKGVEAGVGSESVSQRYGSADPGSATKCHGSPILTQSSIFPNLTVS